MDAAAEVRAVPAPSETPMPIMNRVARTTAKRLVRFISIALQQRIDSFPAALLGHSGGTDAHSLFQSGTPRRGKVALLEFCSSGSIAAGHAKNKESLALCWP